MLLCLTLRVGIDETSIYSACKFAICCRLSLLRILSSSSSLDHPVAINPPCRKFKGASGKKASEDSKANLKSEELFDIFNFFTALNTLSIFFKSVTS